MKFRKPKQRRTVYLDYAAATPIDKTVLKEIRPFFRKTFHNPSALYRPALKAREAIETARREVAQTLHTQPENVLFTSGGTESVNLAIFGSLPLLPPKTGGHIITTAIEHHAVLRPMEECKKNGWKVTYLPASKEGTIDLRAFKEALRPDTILVSIMYANNEIGSIMPIGAIGKEILRWRKEKQTPYPYIHTDACQAAPYLEMNVEKLHVDFLSLNGSKIYGPRGAGVLYHRRGVPLRPQLLGGDQEFGFRSGTEDTAAIVGMGKAFTIVQKERVREGARLRILRDFFWKEITKRIPGVKLNGPALKDSEEVRLPNNLNVTIRDVQAEDLILYLDHYGIFCSSGAACASESDDQSHVLKACGLDKTEIESAVRFTLGRETETSDIRYAVRWLSEIVSGLRSYRRAA